jgi:molecular chaperone DnaK
MSQIIGIDVGFTNCRVAVMEGDRPVVIPNRDGADETPSAVAFTDNHEAVVGLEARRRAHSSPHRVVRGVKRLLGCGVGAAPCSDRPNFHPYVSHTGGGNRARIEIDGRAYAPSEFLAVVLARARATASRYLEESTDQAVLSVPACFSDAQRQATKEAADIAGLEVRRLVSEPTATALNYGYRDRENATIAVADLGGGVFDVSILEVHGGVFEVLSTAGADDLGGWDFDVAVLGHLANEFERTTGRPVTDDPVAIQRLRTAAERARCELSGRSRTYLDLPRLADGPEGPLHLSTSLTRSVLESIVEHLVERLDGPCRRALAGADRTPTDIDTLLLAGGVTRMPAVRGRLENLFGRAADPTLDPTDAVARGTAIQAGILAGAVDEFMLLDVTPMHLGIRVDDDGFVPIIRRNTAIPAEETEVFTTRRDGQSSVTLEVLQGNSDRASDNLVLETFDLTGIPRAEAGAQRIEVTFAIDADGMVEISAAAVQSDARRREDVEASSHRSESSTVDASEAEAADQRGSGPDADRPDMGLDEGDHLGDSLTGITTVEKSDDSKPEDERGSAADRDASPQDDDSADTRSQKIESLRESAASRINRTIENLEDPEDREAAQAYFNRGFEAYNNHDYPNALRYLEKAHRFDEEDPLFKTFYAYVTFLLSPDAADRAKELLREALWADDPQPDPDAHFFLARILKAEDHYKLARRHFRKTLDIDPNRREAERELRACEENEDDETYTGKLLGDLFGS